jgi:hypothetical protein
LTADSLQKRRWFPSGPIVASLCRKGGSAMRVMVIVKATKSSESDALPSEQMLAEMGRFNEELVKAGVMQAGEGLHASSKGKRVWFEGEKRTVVDGPFADTSSLVAGFWIWKVASMDEAVVWAERCPNPSPGETGVIEIRPLFEAEQFAPSDPTGEIRRKEEAMRKAVEARQKTQ